LPDTRTYRVFLFSAETNFFASAAYLASDFKERFDGDKARVKTLRRTRYLSLAEVFTLAGVIV
jgi:hypothetical protein